MRTATVIAGPRFEGTETSALARWGFGNSASLALAAVFSEVTDQRIHPIKRSAVDQMAALPFLRNEPGFHKFLQVKGKAGRRHAKGLSEHTRRYSFAASDNHCTKDAKARRLRQRQEGANDLVFFHTSIFVEISAGCNVLDCATQRRIIDGSWFDIPCRIDWPGSRTCAPSHVRTALRASSEGLSMPIAAPIVAAILLLVAVAPLPYNGYMLIRTVATVVLVWAAVVATHRREQTLAVALVFFALVLNPLLKFRLPREAWMAVDVGGAAVLLFASRHLAAGRALP
jgi:hypothetical protein